MEPKRSHNKKLGNAVVPISSRKSLVSSHKTSSGLELAFKIKVDININVNDFANGLFKC